VRRYPPHIYFKFIIFLRIIFFFASHYEGGVEEDFYDVEVEVEDFYVEDPYVDFYVEDLEQLALSGDLCVVGLHCEVDPCVELVVEQVVE